MDLFDKPYYERKETTIRKNEGEKNSQSGGSSFGSKIKAGAKNFLYHHLRHSANYRKFFQYLEKRLHTLEDDTRKRDIDVCKKQHVLLTKEGEIMKPLTCPVMQVQWSATFIEHFQWGITYSTVQLVVAVLYALSRI